MRASILLLALALAACGAQHSGSPTPRRSNTEISAEEVAASTQLNAYDLVQTLRPGWVLRPAGTMTVGGGPGAPLTDQLMAYVDGQRLGPIDALRSIPKMEVAQVRRYDGVTAQQRFGLGNVGGVVEIITRRGP